MGLLGRLIIGGIIAAIAATAIVIYVTGILNRQKVEDVMRSKNVENALIKNIDRCTNVMTLEDLDSGNTYEIKGADEISYDVDEGDRIYA